MLPGFRFLLAAIVLSTSILVFGLGAAALLRATHEQYVSNPSWRNGPQEQVFAQASEPAQPVLAALRAEPEPAEPAPTLRDQVPTIGLPVQEPEQTTSVASEADAAPQIVATPAADNPASEPSKAETTVEAAAPAATDTLTPADATAAIPEAKPAATANAPAPADPSAALASSALDIASAKLAALNDPATTASKDPPAKAKTDVKSDASKPEGKATKREAKAKKRHRVVRRPPPQQLQQQLDPFGQPQTFATTTATRTRQ
ncbi:hypothetical protein [Bradyrhizobium iriomotense]|uniref:hypothetical protein n=1 Tax=Bradyrhizobium iriomotense TaxID=441950 RepID=UPI001B8A1D75|nr:hypothetical protein [Bradyrhizobium iriomotense]MBR1133197.1 hypothetical protein [Bradyrhizobium iriomotense]